MSNAELHYVIQNQIELNFSFMPFINECGLFIPTSDPFMLGEKLIVNLQLPGQLEKHAVESKVIWITPKNALYQIIPGIGIQFIGINAKTIGDQVKANLDNTMDVGAYVTGISEGAPRKK